MKHIVTKRDRKKIFAEPRTIIRYEFEGSVDAKTKKISAYCSVVNFVVMKNLVSSRNVIRFN